jgi:MFS superfamily sulfate permease-like transporter
MVRRLGVLLLLLQSEAGGALNPFWWRKPKPSRIQRLMGSLRSPWRLSARRGHAAAVVASSSSSSNNNNNNNNNPRQTEGEALKQKRRRDALLGVTSNLLAGVASAVALIPEASTFALHAGLNPLVGLGSTVVLAASSGCLGGRPGMVSGTSATAALIVAPLAKSHGHAAMSLAVCLAGALQFLLGVLRFGKFIRMVPQPVMLGFVNGLAAKVVVAQVPHFQQLDGAWLAG